MSLVIHQTLLSEQNQLIPSKKNNVCNNFSRQVAKNASGKRGFALIIYYYMYSTAKPRFPGNISILPRLDTPLAPYSPFVETLD